MLSILRDFLIGALGSGIGNLWSSMIEKFFSSQKRSMNIFLLISLPNLKVN